MMANNDTTCQCIKAWTCSNHVVGTRKCFQALFASGAICCSTVRAPQVFGLQGGSSSGLLSQGVSLLQCVKTRRSIPHKVAVFHICRLHISMIFILFTGMSLNNLRDVVDGRGFGGSAKKFLLKRSSFLR